MRRHSLCVSTLWSLLFAKILLAFTRGESPLIHCIQGKSVGQRHYELEGGKIALPVDTVYGSSVIAMLCNDSEAAQGYSCKLRVI